MELRINNFKYRAEKENMECTGYKIEDPEISNKESDNLTYV